MPSQRIDPGKQTRARARDALLRRTRAAMVAVSAAAIALSGVLSVVAAQAFKGHKAEAAQPAARSAAPRHGATGVGRLMSERPLTESWTALGTSASLALLSARRPAAARTAVEHELTTIDAACSRFRDDSELMAINGAGGRPRQVSAAFAEAIAVALRAAALTGGLVDPTIGEALVLSGYDRDFADVRSSRVRRIRATAAPGWRAVQLDAKTRTVRMPVGVQLDLGATAKALAADRAATAALAAGEAEGALVNLGGDISTAGIAPGGGWLVRVTDRHDASPDAPGQTVSIASGGLATSSVTVRRWRRRGGMAHHIIDPRSGHPAAEVWRTVSVAAATCVDANVASTAAIVLGERAVPWLHDAGMPARLVAAGCEPTVVCGWPEDRAVAA